MAIEVEVRKLGARTPRVSDPAVAPQEAVLPRTARLKWTLRRRRQRRLQQALELTAWIAGTAVLLCFAAAGLASLH
jgi:hypothetical protein